MLNIYLFVFLFLACLSFAKNDNRATDYIVFFFSIFLVLFTGLRGEGIGFDYDNYVDNIFMTNDLQYMEPGVLILSSVLRPFGSVTLFFMMYAIIAVSIKTYIIRRHTFYPMLALLMYFSIYYLVQEMGQIRYGLSVAICTLALLFLANEEKKKFWVLVFVASLFHFSALIVPPVYFIRRLKINVFMLVAFFILGSAFILYDFSEIMYRLFELMPIEGVSYRAAYYMVTEEENGAFGFNMSLFLRIIELVLFYLYLRNNTTDEYFNALFNFFLYGVVLYYVLNFNQEFASRGSGYFKFLEIVMIPYVISKIEKPQFVFVSILSVVAYSFYSLSKIIYMPGVMEQYVPYHSIFF